jgi:hypothetical protein
VLGGPRGGVRLEHRPQLKQLVQFLTFDHPNVSSESRESLDQPRLASWLIAARTGV